MTTHEFDAAEFDRGITDIEEHLSAIAYWDDQTRANKAHIAARHEELARLTDPRRPGPVPPLAPDQPHENTHWADKPDCE